MTTEAFRHFPPPAWAPQGGAMRPHEIEREAAGLKVWIKLRTEWRQEGRPSYLQAAYADRRREANDYLGWALERLGGLASIW